MKPLAKPLYLCYNIDIELNMSIAKGASNMRKGSKASEETRRKLSEARRGKKQSPEHTAAIKASHHTAEFHEKQSASHKGKKLSEEHKAAIKQGLSTPEAKERMSVSHTGLVQSEETKQKRIATLNSQEIKDKISQGVRKAYQDPEFRERQYQGTLQAMANPEYSQRMSESIKRVQATEEYKRNHTSAMANLELRAKLREQKLGKPLSEEHKAKIKEGVSERALARWANTPEEVRIEHMKKAQIASQEVSTSSLEKLAIKLLDSLGFTYERQYRIGRYLTDFYIPDLNLVLEINGCYWHSCPQCGYTYEPKQQADAKREAFIRGKGYDMLIIWEHDLKGSD